jgi:hypothetical protein
VGDVSGGNVDVGGGASAVRVETTAKAMAVSVAGESGVAAGERSRQAVAKRAGISNKQGRANLSFIIILLL